MMKSIGRFIDNFSRGSRITLGSILLRRDCDFTRCSKIRGAFRVRHFLITRRLRNSTLYLSGFLRICNYCRIVDKIGVSSPPWREKKKKIIIIKIWRIKMAFRCSIIIDSNPDVIISLFLRSSWSNEKAIYFDSPIIAVVCKLYSFFSFVYVVR